MKRLLLAPVFLFVLLVSAPVAAQGVDKIAAVVNDEVISYFDLRNRMSLIFAGSDIPDTPETRQRLAPQVMRRLIDESLQMQEAKRLNIEVTDADIDQALRQIERQNNLPRGGIDGFLMQNGVDKLALIQQIEPEISWAKVVGRRIRPQINIDSEEIDETLKRMSDAKGKPEHLLAEIFLRVDEPENDPEVRQLAERIIQQLKSGADFQGLARTFSQSASAGDGGNLGWIRQGELEAPLEEVIAQMEPGRVAGPVRTLAGYYVLYLRDRRIAQGIATPDVALTLQQLFFPLSKDAGATAADEVFEQATATAARASSCADMESIAGEIGTPLSGGLGTVKLDQLPDPLRNAVENLAVDTPSPPVRTDKGVIVLMVCERTGDAGQEAVRERIRQMLFMQRLEAAARRYLRDLRRAAFIDVRI